MGTPTFHSGYFLLPFFGPYIFWSSLVYPQSHWECHPHFCHDEEMQTKRLNNVIEETNNQRHILLLCQNGNYRPIYHPSKFYYLLPITFSFVLQVFAMCWITLRSGIISKIDDCNPYWLIGWSIDLYDWLTSPWLDGQTVNQHVTNY